MDSPAAQPGCHQRCGSPVACMAGVTQCPRPGLPSPARASRPRPGLPSPARASVPGPGSRPRPGLPVNAPHCPRPPGNCRGLHGWGGPPRAAADDGPRRTGRSGTDVGRAVGEEDAAADDRDPDQCVGQPGPGHDPAGLRVTGDPLSAAARAQAPPGSPGRAPAPGQAAGPPGGLPGAGDLTPREVEVLRLIAGGASNREIARALFLSEATVKTHVNRIFARTGSRDRVQAMRYAYSPRATPAGGAAAVGAAWTGGWRCPAGGPAGAPRGPPWPAAPRSPAGHPGPRPSRRVR